MSIDCIFCKIVEKTIPSQIVLEKEDVIVIKDIRPQAPTHFLIIPKKHIKDISSLSDDDKNLASSLLFTARELSEKANGQSFRLISNNGAQVGQTVFHLHMHYLAGKTMSDF